MQIGWVVTVTPIKKPCSHHDWKRITVKNNGVIILCTEVHSSVEVNKVIHEFEKLRKPCEMCGR